MSTFFIAINEFQKNFMTTGYSDFVDINTQLNELVKNVKLLESSLEARLQGKQNELAYQYDEAVVETNAVLAYFSESVREDNSCFYYHRSLKNMFDHSVVWADEILSAPSFYYMFYGSGVSLQNLYRYMANQAEQFSFSYLRYQNLQYEQKLHNMRRLAFQQALLSMTLILAFATVVYFLGHNILKSIGQISRKSTALSQGEWETEDIEESPYVELNNMAGAFNKMKRSMIDYTKEIMKTAEIEGQLSAQKLQNARKDIEIRETKLIALQAQINPHFLFNTLNMIGRTNMLEDHEKTTGLVGAISEIMSYALEPANKKNTLENEINALKAYIYIQGIRFDERMSISLNIRVDTLNIYTPPMILQPIVENAIIHGLSDKVSGGKISIDVKRIEGFILITIKDNGKGIRAAELEKLIDTDSSPENPYTGKRPSIGLQNVIWKMKLFYEREDLIKVFSAPGKGTRVEIFIPLTHDGGGAKPATPA